MKTLMVWILMALLTLFQIGCDKGPSETVEEAQKSTEEFLGLSGEEQVITNGISDFGGLDLSTAQRNTSSKDLPDLWMEDSPGSKSYVIRPEVDPVFQGLESVKGDDIEGLYGYVVYFITDKNCFYVQYDLVHSSTMTFYGPFDGNPRDELDIKFKKE